MFASSISGKLFTNQSANAVTTPVRVESQDFLVVEVTDDGATPKTTHYKINVDGMTWFSCRVDTGVLYFQQAVGDTAPDFSAASDDDNAWGYAYAYNTNTGVGIAGSTGITLTTDCTVRLRRFQRTD